MEQPASKPTASITRPPRIWPLYIVMGVQAVIFALSITSSINNGTRFGLMMIGPAIGVLLFSLWLGFASRLLWRERRLVAFLMIMLPVAVSFLIHSSAGLALFLYGAPASMMVVLLGLQIGQSSKTVRRLIPLVVGLVFLWAAFTTIRLEGYAGNYLPKLAWRGVPTAEERMLDQHSATSATTNTSWHANEPSWPNFRGPNQDGKASYDGDPLDWNLQPPCEVWRIPVGPGWSSFAYVSGRLFTQEQRGESEAVMCYDAATGRLVWSHEFEDRFSDVVSGAGPRATPTFADGSMFVFTAKGHLISLDAANGDVRWKRDLMEEVSAPLPVWGFSSSPIVAAGNVVVYAGGTGDHGWVAYDAQSGEPTWQIASSGMNYSSAQPVELFERKLLVLNDAAGLYAVDPRDGEVVWRYKPHGWGGLIICQSQQLGPTSLIVPLGDGVGLARLDIEKDRDEWRVSEKWSSRQLKPSFNDFMIHDGDIFGFDQAVFASINAATGKRNWKRGRYGFGQAISLPSVRQIIVLSERGELVLIATDATRHRELDRASALNSKTWNHPIVVDNRLYIRNGEEAVCYDLK